MAAPTASWSLSLGQLHQHAHHQVTWGMLHTLLLCWRICRERHSRTRYLKLRTTPSWCAVRNNALAIANVNDIRNYSARS
jgi:hypothetical protein